MSMSGTSSAPEIRSGELRHRIRFQSRNTAQNADGSEQVLPWTDVCEVWALVEPLNGRELLAAKEIYPETDTRFTIRARDGLDPTMRVLWTNPRTLQDHQYDILDITDVEQRNIVITIMAVERPIQRNV